MKDIILAYSHCIKSVLFIWRAGRNLKKNNLELAGLYLKVSEIHKSRCEEAESRVRGRFGI